MNCKTFDRPYKNRKVGRLKQNTNLVRTFTERKKERNSNGKKKMVKGHET